ncbi:mid1-interacting protein 1-B [Galleria mellonella]|uniref:Mid1-interacting protein 1-B-like n=1 Tax=Galleria mellonella TaxID=7137 RepID=A0A3G1T1F2_GALME|nr:mid1-interacting protein 1-B [Galleria mellonella]AXY94811.1 mid1-interacting protein 1A [Galleria mellonella]
MSFNTDISSKLENSRNTLRKIARHDDTEFSKQSILNDMEKFVKMVNTMDETVLVPSRLMNLPQEGDDDPFNMFAMLNELKTELLWAGDAEEHVERGRRVSDISDTESDASSAAGDSGIDGEDERESAARAAAACRRHLRGLRRSLRHLTAAAAHLTRSYQEEVGAPV